MSGGVGVGQQDPNDSASQYNAIAFIVRQIVATLSTMKLVQVKKVTGGGGAIAAAGTVDVLPLVTQLDGGGNATPHGVVHGIPWWRLQGGHGAVVADPEVGDIGYVVVADRDISGVKSTRKQANPGSLRKYDIADGVYVGGVLNDAPTQYLAFTSGGLTVVDKNGNTLTFSSTGAKVVDKNGNVVEMKAGSIVVTAALLEVDGGLKVTGDFQLGGVIKSASGGQYGGDITTGGNVKAGGNVVAGLSTGDQIGLQTHLHTDPQGGNTGPPIAGT